MGRYATLASQDYPQEIQVWHGINNHSAACFGGLSAYNHIMTAPSIESSKRAERLDDFWTNGNAYTTVSYVANAMFLKVEAKKER